MLLTLWTVRILPPASAHRSRTLRNTCFAFGAACQDWPDLVAKRQRVVDTGSLVAECGSYRSRIERSGGPGALQPFTSDLNQGVECGVVLAEFCADQEERYVEALKTLPVRASALQIE